MRSLPRSFTFAFLLFVLCFPVTVLGALKAWKPHNRGSDSLTNAQRFARGLPPAPPRRLHQPSRIQAPRAGVSSVPITCTFSCNIGASNCNSINIRALDTKTGASLGYLSLDQSNVYTFSSTPASLGTTSSSPFSIYGTKSYIPFPIYLEAQKTDQNGGGVSTNIQESSNSKLWTMDLTGRLTATMVVDSVTKVLDFYWSNSNSLKFGFRPSNLATNPNYTPVTLQVVGICTTS